MAIPAARVAGTAIFLTATFDRTGEQGFFDGPQISPIVGDGPSRLFSMIEKEKSRAIVSAAA